MRDANPIIDNNKFVPREAFLTKGVGVHKDKLHAFEMALRTAGIAHLNIVEVSSILPPGCRFLSKEEGLKKIHPGQITFAVLARQDTDEANRQIVASIGIAVPTGKENFGYISEHHGFGQEEEEAGDYAEDLAVSMLGSTLGIHVDIDEAYDTRKDQYMMSGKIVNSASISQSSKGEKGKWTCVVSAVVFIL